MLFQLVSKLPIKNKEALLNFKGLSQDGRRTDFSENQRASLFNNDDLSTELTFSQIHVPLVAGSSIYTKTTSHGTLWVVLL
jgi:hypothetical protein